jgi:hypothetical protein
MTIVILPSKKQPGKILVATGSPGVEYYTIEKAEMLIWEIKQAIKQTKGFTNTPE